MADAGFDTPAGPQAGLSTSVSPSRASGALSRQLDCEPAENAGKYSPTLTAGVILGTGPDKKSDPQYLGTHQLGTAHVVFGGAGAPGDRHILAKPCRLLPRVARL